MNKVSHNVSHEDGAVLFRGSDMSMAQTELLQGPPQAMQAHNSGDEFIEFSTRSPANVHPLAHQNMQHPQPHHVHPLAH